MASLAEFPPAASGFWSQTPGQDESDENRSDTLRKRYETLLRLSKCLTSARPEDLVTTLAAELRPGIDFDLLDIVVNRATTGEVGSASDCDCQREGSSPCTSGISCLGEEVQSQCSIPLISRGSELGVLVLERLDENDFSDDDIEFLTQVAGQVAMVIDNSMAYRHIAQLTEKLTPENIDFEDEILTETNFEEIVGRSTALRSLLRQVETVAPTDSTVLIYGETGTGKEL